MKRYIPLVIALVSLLSVAAWAQTPTPPRGAASAPPPTTAKSSGGTGAEGKIAYVITDAFPGGILELKAKFEILNTEFEPRQKEIQSFNERIESLKKQIQAAGTTVSAATLNKWNEDGADLEKKLKRAQEDAQALLEKRQGELIG